MPGHVAGKLEYLNFLQLPDAYMSSDFKLSFLFLRLEWNPSKKPTISLDQVRYRRRVCINVLAIKGNDTTSAKRATSWD